MPASEERRSVTFGGEEEIPEGKRDAALAPIPHEIDPAPGLDTMAPMTADLRGVDEPSEGTRDFEMPSENRGGASTGVDAGEAMDATEVKIVAAKHAAEEADVKLEEAEEVEGKKRGGKLLGKLFGKKKDKGLANLELGGNNSSLEGSSPKLEGSLEEVPKDELALKAES